MKMADLRAMLEGLGYAHVATYIQSGNAVFEADEGEAHVEAIEAAFEAHYDFVPRVLVVPAEAYRAVIAQNPYASEAEAEPKFVHGFFLRHTPTEEAVARLRAFDAGVDRFEMGAGVVYLHTPKGLARSKLAERLERTLKVPATARNWRSVLKVAALLPPAEAGDPA